MWLVLDPVPQREHSKREVKILSKGKRREWSWYFLTFRTMRRLVFCLHTLQGLTPEEPDRPRNNHDCSSGALRETQGAVREAVRAGALSSAHDVAEGGLAVALAECCLGGGLGARVSLEERIFGAEGAGATGREAGGSGISPDSAVALFGEGSGGFVVSGSEAALQALGDSVPVRILGSVGGDVLQIECSARAGGALSISLTLTKLSEAHGALAELCA